MFKYDLKWEILLRKYCFNCLLQMLAIQHHFYCAFLTCEISSCLFLKICLDIAGKGTSSSHLYLCALYPCGVLDFLSDQIFGCIPYKCMKWTVCNFQWSPNFYSWCNGFLSNVSAYDFSSKSINCIHHIEFWQFCHEQLSYALKELFQMKNGYCSLDIRFWYFHEYL